MVYYGPVSKGCQRCRKRKIKCDQRRPGCVRCEKSRTPCPGYRDLGTVVFRDETKSVIRRNRQIEQSSPILIQEAFAPLPSGSSRPVSDDPRPVGVKFLPPSFAPVTVPALLSQPITELAANFFFTKYAFDDAHFSSEHRNWLTQSYFEDETNHVLRSAIDAVGTAGISNVFHAPDVGSKSKALYREALTSMNQALSDPAQAVADTTLMAVILLGFFETLNFTATSQYRCWEAHVKGALALLQLRGPEQFTRQRGGQLFVLIRSQILLLCMQQDIAIPQEMVQAMCVFQQSGLRKQWQQHKVAHPGSIFEVSFRIVNLRAAFKKGEIQDRQLVLNTALDIDGDLDAWRQGVTPGWTYTTADESDSTADNVFEGKKHVYTGPWVAEVWNNWRILRILANQLITQCCDEPEDARKARAMSIIRELSIDICTSVSSFGEDNPLRVSLLKPLYLVGLEEVNPPSLRLFAMEQFHQVGMSMGIRQVCIVADVVRKSLNEPNKVTGHSMKELTVPLMPFC